MIFIISLLKVIFMLLWLQLESSYKVGQKSKYYLKQLNL